MRIELSPWRNDDSVMMWNLVPRRPPIQLKRTSDVIMDDLVSPFKGARYALSLEWTNLPTNTQEARKWGDWLDSKFGSSDKIMKTFANKIVVPAKNFADGISSLDVSGCKACPGTTRKQQTQCGHTVDPKCCKTVEHYWKDIGCTLYEYSPVKPMVETTVSAGKVVAGLGMIMVGDGDKGLKVIEEGKSEISAGKLADIGRVAKGIFTGNIGDATGGMAGLARNATKILSGPLSVANLAVGGVPVLGVATKFMNKEWKMLDDSLKAYEDAVDNCGRCKVAIKYLVNAGTSAATSGLKFKVPGKPEMKISKVTRCTAKVTALASKFLGPLKAKQSAALICKNFAFIAGKRCNQVLTEITKGTFGLSCNSEHGEDIGEQECMDGMIEKVTEAICSARVKGLGPMCKPARDNFNTALQKKFE